MKKKIKVKEVRLIDLHNLLKKYRARGYKPYIKGKGNKSIKIEFE